ncbi:MAG: DNA-protecting protein DprA [Hyphomicrobiales bacterium]|nr:DNA-protecting protein DprA [Hyphomicrobiales bacterium]
MQRRDVGPLSDAERLAWLRLIRSEGVGPRTFRGLIDRYGGAAAALAALPRLHREAGRALHVCTQGEAETELEAAAKLGIVFVTVTEKAYPAALAATADAPPLIARRGDPGVLDRPMIAIVGSRNASALGMRFAERLAGDLGEAGFTVVSGLARGIDARAHGASLASGTVAVLAGGHERIYPNENRPLLEKIVECGAAISEMPLNWEPRGRDFPRRNRIVSGLSHGVVVIEAARGSGSLITARFALEQGREVFAVPGSPLDPRAEGTNDLIRQGATLVTASEHVTEVLAPIISGSEFREAPSGLADGAGNTKEPLWEELDIFGEPAEIPSVEISTQEFQPTRADAPALDPHFHHRDDGEQKSRFMERVLDVLGASPAALDDIVRGCGLPASAVRATLLELELQGRVSRVGGDLVQLLP